MAAIKLWSRCDRMRFTLYCLLICLLAGRFSPAHAQVAAPPAGTPVRDSLVRDAPVRDTLVRDAFVRDKPVRDSLPAARPNYKLLRGIFAAQSGIYLGTVYGLSKSWYKNPLTKFTIEDDSREWLQMDKMGHLYTSYQIARHTAALYKMTGISKRQMLVYGAISGVIFQTPIEILDGFSPDYGFSPGDMIANITGSVLYLGQVALWDEVRIQPKFSFHYTSLAQMRPQLLGSSWSERWLKDYNGQTYWFSASPKSFFKGSSWPAWLCFSVGYGIQNMVSAEKDKSIEMGYRPYRQYYLSLDIDLTKIKTRSKFVKTLGFLANSLKIPAPALQISSKGVGFKPFYF